MKSNVLIALLFLATIVAYQDGALAAEDTSSRLETLGIGSDAGFPDGLEMELRSIDAEFDVAYLECQGIESIEPTYGKLFQAAVRQRLLGRDMNIYLVSHNDPLHSPDEETILEPAISLKAESRVASPIKVQTIPGGQYLVVRHRGDYEKLAETFSQFQEWAKAVELSFDDRPVFEHFLTNPDSTPVKDWLTEIYFPVATD